jgi:hypothetical protein
MIASVASVDWGAVVQIMAAASISSNGSFTPTSSKALFVFEIFSLSSCLKYYHSGVYVGIVLSHAVVCCLGTKILARLQNVYMALNIS